MQCGSTGLGKMALIMNIEKKENMTKLPPTTPPEGSLVMYCKTTKPVVWNVWISIEPEDITAIIKVLLSREAIKFMLKALFLPVISKFGFKKKVKEESITEAEAVTLLN